MNNANVTIHNVGFNDFFATSVKNLHLEQHTIARVVAEYRNVYKVVSDSGELSAKVTGKHMFHASQKEDYPAVGDWVALTKVSNNEAVIEAILPRQTLLKRKSVGTHDDQIIAANIDTAFIVESVDKDFNLNRFERYLVIVKEANITPVFILNKVDVISEEDLHNKVVHITKRFGDIPTITTSTKTEQGISDLLHSIQKEKTHCFLGSSGVGKSSIINALLGNDLLKTREINAKEERGRHTTTNRQLYILPHGGLVIDNPGIREVGISTHESGLGDVFEEINELARSCKFSNCSHTNEPNCAVLHAIETNVLDIQKFNNYVKLKKESAYFEMSTHDKKTRDRTFGRMLKNYYDNLSEE